MKCHERYIKQKTKLVANQYVEHEPPKNGSRCVWLTVQIKENVQTEETIQAKLLTVISYFRESEGRKVD